MGGGEDKNGLSLVVRRTKLVSTMDSVHKELHPAVLSMGKALR